MIIHIDKQRKLPKRKPKVGLALSGGGIRGTAHIGVLKALTENNIPIDMISGTSAGSIVASLYASGYSAYQMKSYLETINFQNLIDLKVNTGDLFKQGVKWVLSGKLQIWSSLPTGIIKGDKIENFLMNMLQNRTVRNTKIPLAITAVDINSADTIFFTSPISHNRSILNARFYHNAYLYEAVRASISIPGVFFPKKYRNMTLVDGAVKNNVPTDILKYMGADIIIAVDLGYSGQHNYEIETVGDILMQCIDIMGREVTLMKSEQYADVIIRPGPLNITYKDIKQVGDCIKKGESAALEKVFEIKEIIKSKC
ncbi:patatin-like phospholipase family protein [Selenomonadales bacterium OttesenSCG-928-I06]|nr:patatin-like phospholipase family protein [Selenomonadales bacterium OttesenSCG-928-I06]